MTNEYTLFIKAPLDRNGRVAWINSNERAHWAVRAEKTKQWRTLARFSAAQAKLPTGLDRVHITAYVHKSNNRKHDVGNLAPTMKAIVDGLVDYGLLPDDNNDHLAGPDMRPGEKRPGGGVTITIQDLTDDPTG